MSILIAAFPDMAEVGKRVARALGASYTTILSETFPDSEYHIELRKNPRNKNVVIISSISHDVDSRIVETILAGGIARDYGAREVILMATYFPYMRQDKHFEKYDSDSAKYIMRLFSNFDKIIALDPHLHRIKKLSELTGKAESISAKMLVADYIKKRFKSDFEIIGPDGESEQWSRPIAEALGKKVVVLSKTRFSGTKIKQNDISGKLNTNVIIVDDIISTGKTLAGALAIAKKHGARKLYCIGIHGILAGNAVELIEKHAELITSNTIANKYAKIDVSPVIVEALKKYK